MHANDGRAWLEHHAGFVNAQERIAKEARILRVDPTSATAIRHALASYEAETGKSPRTHSHPTTPPQEGLIP